MKLFRVAAVTITAGLLGVAGAAHAQFFGGMGGGMMGPGFGSGTTPSRMMGSGIGRGSGYGFGMSVGSYCYGMMGPATG